MGLGAVPGRQAAFREGLEQAVLYAKALGCPRYLILPSSPSMTQDPAARGLGSGRRHQVLERLRSLSALALLHPCSRGPFYNILCVVCYSQLATLSCSSPAGSHAGSSV